MSRSAPPRRRLPRLVTAGIAILATATLPAIFLPDAASADDVFNCHGTPFSEATYLTRYPDVRAAVEAGAFPNGCAHFAAHGHAEGRSGTPDGWQPPGGQPTESPTSQPTDEPTQQPTQQPSPQPSESESTYDPSPTPTQPYSPVYNCFGTPFSDSVYLERYSDVAPAVASGEFTGPCDHFARVGIHQGRSGTPNGWEPPIETGPNDGKPRTAVAIGDSFISGEGAGDYQPVPNRQGDRSGFPGWDESNGNAFFCHRSANASLFRAQLDDIDTRINLACSGGQPTDIRNDSSNRDRGRNVEAQRDQLLRVAQNHDIDLVLIGLGSNNSSFTFGGEAIGCALGFTTDGFLMDALHARVETPNFKVGACAAGDFPSDAQMTSAENETYDAVREILWTLRQVDTDGQHRIVLQDYTNPLPPDLHPDYHTEPSGGRFDLGGDAERDDDRSKFRGLVSERYEGGCPIHRRSLAPAHQFSERLGGMVARVADHLRADFPDERIVYLNVQNAFTGARLCETANPPSEALATPTRLMSHPDGNFRTTLDWLNKFHLAEMADTCAARYHTCQESWHPNAAGHGVLGQCLSFAARTGDTSVRCRRDPGTGQISG